MLPMASDPSDRVLRIAAVCFAVAVLVHNSDHLRRGGDSVATDVFVLGTAGMVLEVAVVALVLMNHRVGPLAAAAVGASLTAGYLLVHLSPQRSWLSDSLTAGEDVSWFSWVAVIGLVLASMVLAAAGWAVLRARGGLASAAHPRHRDGPAVHPVTTALAVGNVVILAGSLATL
jgi:hypothetical protein